MAAYRVPRSRADETHRFHRDTLQSALEPLIYEAIQEGHAVRAAFEQAFAQAVGQQAAVGVHSGTVGLFVALRACGVGPGDEVITVGNSDISTTAAIRHCGAVPVLADVQAADYTLDPALVEPLITPRTRALMPVDLHGHPANVRALRPLADAHGLRIVEDAALAAGAEDHGQHVGAYADAAVFSFAPFKPLGSVGNGAAIVTNHPDIAERLRQLVGYGYATDTSDVPFGHQCYVAEGYNVPLDPLQAALLTVKLPHLSAWTQKRRAIAEAYRAGLSDSPAITPTFRAESAPTFRSYTIRVPGQGAIHAALRASGIETVLHYTPPAYRHPVYGGSLPNADQLPTTDQLAQEIVCLPVTPELTDDDVQYVVSTLRQLLEK